MRCSNQSVIAGRPSCTGRALARRARKRKRMRHHLPFAAPDPRSAASRNDEKRDLIAHHEGLHAGGTAGPEPERAAHCLTSSWPGLSAQVGFIATWLLRAQLGQARAASSTPQDKTWMPATSAGMTVSNAARHSCPASVFVLTSGPRPGRVLPGGHHLQDSRHIAFIGGKYEVPVPTAYSGHVRPRGDRRVQFRPGPAGEGYEVRPGEGRQVLRDERRRPEGPGQDRVPADRRAGRQGRGVGADAAGARREDARHGPRHAQRLRGRPRLRRRPHRDHRGEARREGARHRIQRGHGRAREEERGEGERGRERDVREGRHLRERLLEGDRDHALPACPD